MSGEMGLGFSAIHSESATQIPFWHTLVEAGGIANQEMAFWLARTPIAKTAGVLTLGGTNSSLFTGRIDFLNLTSSDGSEPRYWSLQLSG